MSANKQWQQKQKKRQQRSREQHNDSNENCTKQIPLLIRNNIIVNNNGILQVIENMISRKLMIDGDCFHVYPYRHLACFLSGIPGYFEKGVYGRELTT